MAQDQQRVVIHHVPNGKIVRRIIDDMAQRYKNYEVGELYAAAAGLAVILMRDFVKGKFSDLVMNVEKIWQAKP